MLIHSLQSILFQSISTMLLVSFQVQRHKIYGKCLLLMGQNNHGMNLVVRRKFMTMQVEMFRSQLVDLFLLLKQVGTFRYQHSWHLDLSVSFNFK